MGVDNPGPLPPNQSHSQSQSHPKPAESAVDQPKSSPSASSDADSAMDTKEDGENKETKDQGKLSTAPQWFLVKWSNRSHIHCQVIICSDENMAQQDIDP